MIKFTCDRCGDETQPNKSVRFESLIPSVGSVSIGLEVLFLFNGGVSDAHHLCKACANDLLYQALSAASVQYKGKIFSSKQLLSLNQKLESDIENLHNDYAKALDETRQVRQSLATAKQEIKALQEDLTNQKLELTNAKVAILPKKAEESKYRDGLLEKLKKAEEYRVKAHQTIEELTRSNQDALSARQKAEVRVQNLECELDAVKAELAKRSKQLDQAKAELEDIRRAPPIRKPLPTE